MVPVSVHGVEYSLPSDENKSEYAPEEYNSLVVAGGCLLYGIRA